MDEDKPMMMMFYLLLAAVCSPVFSDEWRASVVPQIDAVVSSCVVVPCTFSHSGGNLPSSRLRGVWHLGSKKDDLIFYEDQTRVLDNFKGRTRMLGELGKGNCTLEIKEIRDHDNGPFCFRAELVVTDKNEPTKEKFSFVEQCVNLNMLKDPAKPTLTHFETAYEGRPYTITCSVTHTCPSHPPQITWSPNNKGDSTVSHKNLHSGLWEVQSILTLIPEVKDDHSDVTCTAQFNGRKTSSETLKLYVKRAENYNHIIIPTVVGVITAVIFGGLCIFMAKKYKGRIAELQSQDGSMWNRISRMSRRFQSGGPGPSRSDQRRSIWSRFSRRPRGDVTDFGQGPNNIRSSADQKVSKPRFPSPKSQPKSCNYKEDVDVDDDYMNTGDLNVYGNI